MTRGKTKIDRIESVLKKYSELQVNLSSKSARAQVAKAILSEIEVSVPGLMGTSELAVVPPYDLANNEASFGAPED